MFERYTERARQAIFFGRYEAQLRNSPWIETEHLLLGLLREEEPAGHGLSDQIRELVQTQFASPVLPPPFSYGDLPLSFEAKSALGYAAEEAGSLDSRAIETRHLVLGLLRVPECAAALALNRHGISYDIYRGSPIGTGSKAPAQLLNALASASIEESMVALGGLIKSASESLIYTDDYGEQRLKRESWSRKEALGHLVDFATSHHQLFARALTEPGLVVSGPVSDEWVAAQDYRDYSWTKLIDLWIGLNELLIHVLSKIPETKLTTSCRIGIAEPIALKDLVIRYAAHCDDIMGQILAHL